MLVASPGLNLHPWQIADKGLHSALAYGVLSRGDVALFLPFGRTKRRQWPAKSDTRRKEKSADVHCSDCTIQQW
jgi:hypothetical protein